MKHMFKVGIASLALAAMVPAYAEENETVGEGAIGWTPIAVGLATPVQLPWGLNRWDVFGLDLNVFYSDAPKVYGLDVGGFATAVREDNIGLTVSALFNLACKDVYGFRATLGLNMCARTVYGVDAGLIGLRNTINGLDVHFLGSAQHNICGLQISGLANVTAVESYGATMAGIANLAKTAYGLQFAGLFNMTDELHGCQVALVNYADFCPNGFQIGLVNIIMSNQIKVLPLVNGHF
ncbi:MAG: hypothetical protein ACI4R9_08735 [Kiritimatiellia bacterium]